MKIGDFIKYEHSGASWTGWVLGIEKEPLYGHEIATIWRPNCPVSILTWPICKSRVSVEVMNEDR